MLNNKITNPEELYDAVNSFRISRIILSAFELDMFSAMGSNEKTSAEISSMIHCNEKAVDRLLSALVTTGLVIKKGTKYSNSDTASKFLVKSSPALMGGIAHVVNLWDSWDTLTDAVRIGRSILNRGAINDRGKDWLEAFIAAMHARGGKHAKEILRLLNFENVKTVIDIGGGSGAFLFEFIKKNKELEGVVYDLPNVIPITKKYIKKEGFKDSVYTVQGDYLKDDLGCEYDLAFLSAVIHSNSPKENQLLFKKCFDSLNLNGQIVILDYVMDKSRTEPPSGALFSINMLVGTDNGDTYTQSEITAWLKKAGFKNIKKKETPLDTALMIGYKI